MLFALAGSAASFFQEGLPCPSNYCRYRLFDKYVNKDVRTISMYDG